MDSGDLLPTPSVGGERFEAFLADLLKAGRGSADASAGGGQAVGAFSSWRTARSTSVPGARGAARPICTRPP